MKLDKKNIMEIIVVIIAVLGILYSFYNVLSGKILKSENRQEIQELTDMMLHEQKHADRLECVSKVFVKNGEELVQDKLETVQFIYDYEFDRLQTVRNTTNEIIEETKETTQVYTKGISPVYIKNKKSVEELSEKKWYHYECEAMYGAEKKGAQLDTFSYGYLQDIDNIIKIENVGDEELGDVSTSKYVVTIKNSLREDLTEDMGDTGLRKMLSGKGLNAMLLRNGYPTVYNLLKEVYNSETEDINVWVDENGKMVRLEKDCTFSYYVKVMKENSDMIKNKLGRYDYPRVTCVQDYEYNLEAAMIKLPKEFTEL